MCNRHSQAEEVTCIPVTCGNSNEIAAIGSALFGMKQIARMVLSLGARKIAEIKTQNEQTADSRQQTADGRQLSRGIRAG